MRVLVAAVYDAPREGVWQGDSMYLWARYMVRAARERGHFVYWVLPNIYQPEPMEGVEVLRAPFPDGVPRTNLFQSWQIPTRVMSHFPGAQGLRPLDAIMVNDAHLGLLYQQYFSAKRFYAPVPVVVWSGIPTVLGWDETNWIKEGDDSPLFVRACGLALTEHSSCSLFAAAREVELVRQYCPSQLVDRYIRRVSLPTVMCVDSAAMDTRLGPNMEKAKRHDQFSLYFGGRFTGTKRGEKSVQQYIRLMMTGRDVGIHITAVGGAKKLDALLKKYGDRGFNIYRNLGYDEAMAVLARCHASVFWQLNNAAAAPYEQLYSGLIVLFKEHGFLEEGDQLPPNYPFWFRTENECFAWLEWLYDHLEEAQVRLEELRVRPWLKEHVEKMRGAHALWEIAESRTATWPLGPRLEIIELVGKSLTTLGEPVGLEQLLQAMSAICGKPVIQRIFMAKKMHGVMPLTVCKVSLPDGWVDDCKTSIPRFVKRGD